MSDEGLRQELKELIVERLFLKIEPDQIKDDDNLMEVHNLDSVNVFELVVGLEEVYGISFEDEEFDIEAFQTVNSIAALVEARRAQ
jgi:acyl carrier protein